MVLRDALRLVSCWYSLASSGMAVIVVELSWMGARRDVVRVKSALSIPEFGKFCWRHFIQGAKSLGNSSLLRVQATIVGTGGQFLIRLGPPNDDGTAKGTGGPKMGRLFGWYIVASSKVTHGLYLWTNG